MTVCWNWRIGLLEPDLQLGSFINYGIPVPDEPGEYVTYGSRVPTGDGGEQVHGFETFTVLWSILEGKQMFQLKSFVDDARAGTGLLFLTIDKAIGLDVNHHWIDISGKPAFLEIPASSLPNRNGNPGMAHYNNVAVTLRNVTVINDPSSYSVE